MVRILANGDIVPDDDPRAQSRSRGPNQNRSQQSQRGGVHSAADHNENNYYRQGQPEQQGNIFTALNQKLIGLGIPPFTIGNFVIEPIVTVGMLLALLVFGLPGLLFGAVLFAVSQWSQQPAQSPASNFFGGNRGPNSGGNRWGGGGGGGQGHRLGFS